MEDIDNWIYIIFIVVAAISSVAKSINKKRPQDAEHRRPVREVVARDSDGDDFFPAGDIFPEKKIPPAPARKSHKSVKQMAQASRNRAPDYQRYEEGTPSLTTKQSTSAATDGEQPAISLDSLPSDTDEWRKAFIYNEIFARKY